MTLVLLAVVTMESFEVRAQSAKANRLPAVFEGVGIDQKLDQTIPLDLTFLDANGRDVSLSKYFSGDRPVILNLVYHDCPMLCNIMLESFAGTLKEMEFSPAEEFDVLTVSFSAKETPEVARVQKDRLLSVLDRDGAENGWHFLTGTEENIARLTSSVGFNYRFVEESGEYAHPAALIFLSGEGKITRYIQGMSFRKKDVRRAVVEASEGRVGDTVDQIFLFCYQYDANANTYVLQATQLMKLAGLLTLFVVATGLFIFWRRERHRQMVAMATHA
jgi:protein SCO1